MTVLNQMRSFLFALDQLPSPTGLAVMASHTDKKRCLAATEPTAMQTSPNSDKDSQHFKNRIGDAGAPSPSPLTKRRLSHPQLQMAHLKRPSGWKFEQLSADMRTLRPAVLCHAVVGAAFSDCRGKVVSIFTSVQNHPCSQRVGLVEDNTLTRIDSTRPSAGTTRFLCLKPSLRTRGRTCHHDLGRTAPTTEMPLSSPSRGHQHARRWRWTTLGQEMKPQGVTTVGEFQAQNSVVPHTTRVVDLPSR